jgi:hypothetical protein
MSSSIGRLSLVLILLGLAGVARLAVQPPTRPSVGLPSVNTLLAGTGWRVVSDDSAPFGEANLQWSLSNAAGATSLLYVASTDRVQTMIHWSGELGFEGDGYLIRHSGTQSVRLGDGTSATVSAVDVWRISEHLLVAYCVVGPDGVMAHATDDLLRTGWEVLRGTEGPYYLVRVATPVIGPETGADQIADRLFAKVLPILQARLRAAVK